MTLLAECRLLFTMHIREAIQTFSWDDPRGSIGFLMMVEVHGKDIFVFKMIKMIFKYHYG